MKLGRMEHYDKKIQIPLKAEIIRFGKTQTLPDISFKMKAQTS